MKAIKTLPALLISLFAASAFAQSAPAVANETQGDVKQQERIEQGLQSGQLTTREAAKLEKEESKVDKAEARALKDGTLTNAERQRINRMQNKVSRDISADKHNGQTANPNSPSSQRMQADVQRDINQEKRIAAGVRNGSLTNREAGKLERSEAGIDRAEARAGADGHINAKEQSRIQHRENRASKRIYREKHDRQHAG